MAGLKKKQAASASYKKVADSVDLENTQQMTEQVEVFKTNLETFARKYKSEINKNPEFRQMFVQMCSLMGVDPLSSAKNSFWAILGMGDFYYELAVQIVEVCMSTRRETGGLIDLSELVSMLQKTRGTNAEVISADDVERAIKKLGVLGNGFQVLTVGNRKLVQSVALEMSSDHTTVLELAQENGGVVNNGLIRKELGWRDEHRVESVLQFLLAEGMAWIDQKTENGEEDDYYVLSLCGGF
eukprot:TRINITY_DN505_c0_g1_i3.p1 TRINITY_DN505_c0_g1~~TRINITY_DN505_c0_g1_i3.p1  ORF type:complete len:241 (-),score=66.09 TRINITY_DN505_c0_g1_i3:186-908(-)